jgi:hypothetical protein
MRDVIKAVFALKGHEIQNSAANVAPKERRCGMSAFRRW